MTIKDQIQAANSVFLSKDFFGEDLIFYPAGRAADKVETVGIWDADNLEGRNQVEGDGINLEGRGGRRIRQTVMIEVATTLAVDEHREPPDVFKRVSTGEIVQLKRIVGSDSGGLMTLECVNTMTDKARYPARKG